MRILITIFIAVIFYSESYCQIDSLKTESLDVVIMVLDQEKVKKELELFFIENKIVPDLYEESRYKFTSKFSLNDKQYFELTDKIEYWGVVYSKTLKSVNYTEKLRDVNIEIDRLEKESEEYADLLKEVDIKSENHVLYWEKLENTKSSLRKQIQLREEYLKSNKKFKVSLDVKEENILSNEPDFSFVNMPGFQFSYFTPVNEDGSYPKSMNGYSLKYLMNRRKTYLELGLFKSNQIDETDKYDELYKFGLGQDLYSSHLGRGSRKFLNLYTGFNLGVFILTGGNVDNLISWYATPSIGLEIYKTKNILLDTKVGYFLPFKENRNMRGFLIEASFNVVF